MIELFNRGEWIKQLNFHLIFYQDMRVDVSKFDHGKHFRAFAQRIVLYFNQSNQLHSYFHKSLLRMLNMQLALTISCDKRLANVEGTQLE